MKFRVANSQPPKEQRADIKFVEFCGGADWFRVERQQWILNGTYGLILFKWYSILQYLSRGENLKEEDRL